MNDDERFSSAGEVLKTLFDRLLPDDAAGYTGFFSGWEKIAGAETAMHVYPKDIVNNILILETDHPGWSQRIRMRQEDLLKTIRGSYPDLNIKRIRIVIGDSRFSNESRGEVFYRQETEVPQPVEPLKTKSKPISEEEENFFNLLETMRRRGDS